MFVAGGFIKYLYIMKKLLIPFSLLLLFAIVPAGCRMAPKDEPGDTVAASVFAPVDTAALNRKARLAMKKRVAKDSVDIFYIGDGSTHSRLQLVSYPSRRDTVVYGKARRITKKGNADFGHVVRIKLWVSDKQDTLVQSVEEIEALDSVKASSRVI